MTKRYTAIYRQIGRRTISRRLHASTTQMSGRNNRAAYILLRIILQGGSKSRPGYYCNSFVYCQPPFIIFADVHYSKFATSAYIVSPPNMVCVTTLPCNILIMLTVVIELSFCSESKMANNGKYSSLVLKFIRIFSTN